MSAMTPTPAPGTIDDAELHAWRGWAAGACAPRRRRGLAAQNRGAARVADYAALNAQLRPLRARVERGAPDALQAPPQRPLARPRRPELGDGRAWPARAGAGRVLGYGPGGAGRGAARHGAGDGPPCPGLPSRAVVARTPSSRRTSAGPSRVDGAHEEQLVRWLKRLNAPCAPQLQNPTAASKVAACCRAVRPWRSSCTATPKAPALTPLRQQ